MPGALAIENEAGSVRGSADEKDTGDRMNVKEREGQVDAVDGVHHDVGDEYVEVRSSGYFESPGAVERGDSLKADGVEDHGQGSGDNFSGLGSARPYLLGLWVGSYPAFCWPLMRSCASTSSILL
jgi:hypothetical protein